MLKQQSGRFHCFFTSTFMSYNNREEIIASFISFPLFHFLYFIRCQSDTGCPQTLSCLLSPSRMFTPAGPFLALAVVRWYFIHDFRARAVLLSYFSHVVRLMDYHRLALESPGLDRVRTKEQNKTCCRCE